MKKKLSFVSGCKKRMRFKSASRIVFCSSRRASQGKYALKSVKKAGRRYVKMSKK